MRLPGGRVTFANDRAPRVASRDLPGSRACSGSTTSHASSLRRLSRLVAVRAPCRVGCGRHGVGSGPAPCPAAVSAASGGGYTADEIAGAYGIGNYYPSDEGAGQTIALFESRPMTRPTSPTYQQCYGTSTPSPTSTSTADRGRVQRQRRRVGARHRAGRSGWRRRRHILVYQAPQTTARLRCSTRSPHRTWPGDLELVGHVRGAHRPAGHQRREHDPGGDGRPGPVVLHLLGRQRLDHVLPDAGGRRPDTSLSVIDPGSQPFATGVGGTILGTTTGLRPPTAPTPARRSGTTAAPTPPVTRRRARAGASRWLGRCPPTSRRRRPAWASSRPTRAQACGAQLCRRGARRLSRRRPHHRLRRLVDRFRRLRRGGSRAGRARRRPLWAAFTALANASPAAAA